MIIGITGAICSGKHTFAQYLVDKYGFEVVNLLDLFKHELKKIGKKKSQKSPLKKSRQEEGFDREDEEIDTVVTASHSRTQVGNPEDSGSTPQDAEKKDEKSTGETPTGKEDEDDDDEIMFCYYESKK